MNNLFLGRPHFLFQQETPSESSLPENIRKQFREEMKNLVDEVNQSDADFLIDRALDHLEALGQKFDDIGKKEKYKTFVYEYLESHLNGVSKESFREESEKALEQLETLLKPLSPEKEGAEAQKPNGDLKKVESEMNTALEKVEGFKIQESHEEFPTNYNSPNEVKQGLLVYNTKSESLRNGAQELSFAMASMQQSVAEYEAYKESKSFGSKLAFWKEDPQGEALEKNLKIFQYEYNLARKKLDTARAELAVQAPLLNEAPEKAKAAILADESVEEKEGETKSKIELLKENKELILKQKQNLEAQREGLKEKAEELDETDSVSGSVLQGLLDAKEAVEKALLASPNHPALLDQLAKIEGQVNRIGAAKTVIEESGVGINTLLETKDGELTALNIFSLGINETIASLEYSSKVLEQQIQLKESTLQGIDDMDRIVAEFILTNNIQNDLLFQSMDTQWENLPKEISTGMGSRLFDLGDTLWSNSVGAVGSAVKWSGGKLGEGLDWVGTMNSNLIDKGPSWLKWTLKPVTVPLNLSLGILKGASKLVEGIGMLVESPLQVVKGLGALIGRDPETGDWSLGTSGDSWKAMGSAIIAWEDISSGNFDKALQGAGEALFNIASFVFTGGGAAGVKGAATAGANAVKFTTKLASKAPKGLQTLSRGAAYAVAPTTYMAGASFHVVKNIVPASKDLGRNIAKAGKKFGKPKPAQLVLEQAALVDDIARTTSRLGVNAGRAEKLIQSILSGAKNPSLKDLARIGLTSADDVQRFYRVLNANKKITKITEQLASPKLQQAEAFRLARQGKPVREQMRMRWADQGGRESVLQVANSPARAMRSGVRYLRTKLTPKSIETRLGKVNKRIDDLAQGNLAQFKNMTHSDLALMSKESLIGKGLLPKEIHAFYKLRSLKKFQRNLEKAKLNFESPYKIYELQIPKRKNPVSVKLEDILTIGDETYRVGEKVKVGNQERFILGFTPEGHMLLGKVKPPKGVWKKAGDLEDFIRNNPGLEVKVKTKFKDLTRVDARSPKAAPKGASNFNKVRARFGKNSIVDDLLANGNKLKPGQEVFLTSGGKNYIVKYTKNKLIKRGNEQYKIFEVTADGTKKLIRKSSDSPLREGFGKLMFDPEGTLAMPVEKAFSSQSVLKRMVTRTEPKLWQNPKRLGDKYSETALKIGQHDVQGINILTETGEVLTFRPKGNTWALVSDPSVKFNFQNQTVKIFDTLKLKGQDITVQGIRLKSVYGNKGALARMTQAATPRIFTQTPSLKRAYLLLRSKGTRVSDVITARQTLIDKIQELKAIRKYVDKATYQNQIGALTKDLSAAIALAQSQGTIAKLFPVFKEVIKEARFLDNAFVSQLERHPNVARALALTGLSLKGVSTTNPEAFASFSPAALRLAFLEELSGSDLPDFYETFSYAAPKQKRAIDDGSDIKFLSHKEIATVS